MKESVLADCRVAVNSIFSVWLVVDADRMTTGVTEKLYATLIDPGVFSEILPMSYSTYQKMSWMMKMKFQLYFDLR